MLPSSTRNTAWAVADGLAWAVADRLVLLLNHLLAAEPQAQARMRPHAGRHLALVPPPGAPLSQPLRLAVTPAGLFERPDEASGGASDGRSEPDLTVRAADDLPKLLAGLLAGQGPRWVVEGDAALAADVNWLVENLRWEAADDLSRLVGPVTAQVAAQAAGAALENARAALRLVARLRGTGSAAPSR
jgi:ubiquinone biosynthesis accessory factor UbiJ